MIPPIRTQAVVALVALLCLLIAFGWAMRRGGGGEQGSGSMARVTPEAPARVSLNSADVAALYALVGIGPVTAQKIVDDRARNGPFVSVDEFDRVAGIGPATIASLRDLVTP